MSTERTTTTIAQATLVVILSASPLGAQARQIAPVTNGVRPTVACATMAGKTIPESAIGLRTRGATLDSAKLDPGTGPVTIKYNFVPEHCYITGSIKPIDPQAPDIKFAVAIPTLWNQKAWQFGGNQSNGFIPLLTTLGRGLQGSPMGPGYPPRTPFPITEGYATFGDDSGHQGTSYAWNMNHDLAGMPPPGAPPNTPSSDTDKWIGNDESYRNFAHEHVKKVYDSALWVMQQMYGVRPSAVYYGGESQGGKSALMAAIRYPQDYAGVICVNGIADMMSWMLDGLYRQKVQVAPGAWIPPVKVRVIRDEILRQCDDLDGLVDGVINNYADCNLRFDPSVTPDPLARIRCPNGADTGNTCLSDAQMATANAIHGPVDLGFPLANGYSTVPGFSTGQEILINQAFENVSGFPVLGQPPKTVNPGDLGRRYPAITFDLVNKPFSAYKEQIQEMSALVDAPTDWSAMVAAKTKLIIAVAGSDHVLHARTAMRFWEEAVKRNGQGVVDQAARLYVTPGADHQGRSFSATTGTAQPRYADLMGALVNWVEKGTAPDSLVQTWEEALPPYTVLRARPLCRYPRYPRYKGSGAASDANSYTCAMPQLGSGVARRTTQ